MKGGGPDAVYQFFSDIASAWWRISDSQRCCAGDVGDGLPRGGCGRCAGWRT